MSDDSMEAEAEAELRGVAGPFDLPDISVPRGGIIAAGGWCAPNIQFYDIAAPMTDAETIVYLRKALADEKFKVKSLLRQAKAQRKRTKGLERFVIESVLRG